MRSNRLAILCAAFGFASFFNCGAQAQITVDGTRDAGYGSALAVQTCGTYFGAGAGGSSLANAYAVNDGTHLYLFIGGNIQGNYNKFLIFIDSKTGGQNTLNFTSGPDNTSNLTNMKFDSSFEADYFIVFRWGGSSGNAYGDLATLGASGSAVSSSSIISAGTLSQGVSWAAVNTASNGPTDSGPGESANVTTGMEFKIPLSIIGNPSASVKICAFVSGGDGHFVSNQLMAGLPLGTQNLGTSAASRDLTTYSGNQFFTVAAPSVLDTDGDSIGDATDPDDDNDGLDDTVETNTGVYVDANNTGTNPLSADTDGDGFSDKDEINGTSSLARTTSPFKKNYATMLVAGNFLTPNWSDEPTADNSMTRVSGQEFAYTSNYNFRSVGSFFVKFLGNSFANEWGVSATPGVAAPGVYDAIPFTVNATGFHTFSFNHDTLAYSIARTVFPDFAAYKTAYALAGDEAADDDSDGLSNENEYANDSDPLSNDTDGDGLTDNFEVIGFNDFSILTSPITSDTDGDGLRDAWELQFGLDPTDNGTLANYVNNTGLLVSSNPNGANADPDADGLTNAEEQAAGTNPLAAGTGFASAFSKITVPGSFNGFNAGGNAANTMQLVGNFSWKLLVYFAAAPTGSSEYKFAAGSWTTNWGPSATPGLATPGGSNIPASSVLTAAGYYVFSFNDNTLSYSLAPLATLDADTDGLPDEWEAYYGGYLNPKVTDLNPATAYVSGSTTTAAQAYASGGNPIRDTTPPAIELASGVPILAWVPLNGTLPAIGASDVTASDNLGTPTVQISYNVNGNNVTSIPTSEVATAVISYTAVDADGNSASLTRTVILGDAAPGWRAMNWPPTLSISTVGSGNVYGQIFVEGATVAAGAAPDIQAWVGVSTTNTDPATWDASAWNPAVFNAQSSSNDEYVGTISGASMAPGSYYYAYRWQIGSAAFFYAGIKSDGSGAGPWDGATNVNGILTVSAAEITFANVQFPTAATANAGDSVDLYVQFYAALITDAPGAPNLGQVRAQVGANATNTNPGTWASDAWVDASWNAQSASNDEYKGTITGLPEGTYYTASRFSLDGGATWIYGGINGVWSNDSGTITVSPAAPTGSTFLGAYPGKSMTDVAPNGLTYLANYAFGGDSNTQPILPVQDMSDPDKLRLIVVYRTDDPTLPLSGLRGEATTDLSGAWDLPDVSVTDGDRTGLPDNLTRKVISVDRGSDPKKFLRATVTR